MRAIQSWCVASASVHSTLSSPVAAAAVATAAPPPCPALPLESRLSCARLLRPPRSSPEACPLQACGRLVLLRLVRSRRAPRASRASSPASSPRARRRRARGSPSSRCPHRHPMQTSRCRALVGCCRALLGARGYVVDARRCWTRVERRRDHVVLRDEHAQRVAGVAGRRPRRERRRERRRAESDAARQLIGPRRRQRIVERRGIEPRCTMRAMRVQVQWRVGRHQRCEDRGASQMHDSNARAAGHRVSKCKASSRTGTSSESQTSTQIFDSSFRKRMLTYNMDADASA